MKKKNSKAVKKANAPKKLQSKWSLKVPPYMDKKDKRYKDQMEQIKTRGFCDFETISLYNMISEFILPRLKRYNQIRTGYPMGSTEELWNEMVETMIFAFEWIGIESAAGDIYSRIPEEEKIKSRLRYDEGMRLFSEYFRYLWW